MKALFVFALLITFVSCKTIDKQTQFNTNSNTDFTIPATTVVNVPINITIPDIDASNPELDSKKDKIEEAKLTIAKLNIKAPKTSNLNFLKAVSIFISADGLGETKIAWNDNVPNNTGNELNLTTTDTDLKEYIKKGNYTLRFNIETDEAITENHTITIHTNFFIDAKVLGI